MTFSMAWRARFARVVGLGLGLALASATAQELTIHTQAPSDMSADPSAGPPVLLGPGAVRIPDRGFPPNMSSPVAAAPGGGPRSPSQGGPSNPLWSTPLTSLSNLRERPIFSPSRRPPTVAAPVAPQLPSASSKPDRPLLALLGVVAGKTDGIAIFRDEATKAIVRMKTGESHSGWTLRTVKGREATLRKGQETAVVVILNPMTPATGSAQRPDNQ